MLKLNEMLRLGERTPPSDELAQAFAALFKSQQKEQGGSFAHLEDAQIEAAASTFEFLKKHNTEVEGFGISTEDLRIALRNLNIGSSKAHKKLATALYEELERRRQLKIKEEGKADPLHVDLVPYIVVLCQNNGALVARDLVEKHWVSDLKDARTSRWNGKRDVETEIGPSSWLKVLRGLIRERLNDEVASTVEMMRKYDVPFDQKLHATVVSFYAYWEQDMEMTKKWYSHPIAGNGIPSNAVDANVLKLCIRKNAMEWGESILARLVERDPKDKTSLDTILQWAAARGRGVDEIEHMMKIMERRNRERPDLQPNMDTINGLIEFANMRGDPYTAERYYALGERWGFTPNARTHLLQLDYRIKVKDLSGAMAAYKRAQGEDFTANEDIPYINKLIVAFCDQADLRYDTIMSLVEDLTERKAAFDPETVSALSLLHIGRNEIMDLADLLNTHTYHYSHMQRTSIHSVLLTYALDPTTPEVQVWEIYKILTTTFSDLSNLETRVKIMNSFFSRHRPDIAITIFSDLRQQKDKALRPTNDTYCSVLVALAEVGTITTLETVRNFMNVDSEIEPNTKLYNALMLAYTAHNQFSQALSFWQDIAHSREGPSYNSIRLAFRACERSSMGEETARAVWAKLKRERVEITPEVYAAYIGALAGHGKFDECVDLLAEAEAECGVPVNALM